MTLTTFFPIYIHIWLNTVVLQVFYKFHEMRNVVIISSLDEFDRLYCYEHEGCSSRNARQFIFMSWEGVLHCSKTTIKHIE